MLQTLTLPKLSPTMEEGTIARWRKREGEWIAAGDILVDIATDKATIEYAALDEGWLRKRLIAEGSGATIYTPFAIVSSDPNEDIESELAKLVLAPPVVEQNLSENPIVDTVERIPKPRHTHRYVPSPPVSSLPPKNLQAGSRVKASPLAKKLAKEQQMDLSTVQGSGPGGRIVSEDLCRAQPLGIVTFGRIESPQHPAGSYLERPLSPMRKAIAERLQFSKQEIPHFYLKQQIDAAPLIACKEQLQTVHLKVSYNDCIVRAVALALRHHPDVNVGFHVENHTLIQYQTVDISVAVTVEGGLITPIVRHADYKNLGQIATEIRSLAQRAKEGKLKEEEYLGGSFSVSNLGMYGIPEFSAVINPPQGAILAVGAIHKGYSLQQGSVVPSPQIVVTLSADHRVIDGAGAARFLKTLKELLENPISLVL